MEEENLAAKMIKLVNFVKKDKKDTDKKLKEMEQSVANVSQNLVRLIKAVAQAPNKKPTVQVKDSPNFGKILWRAK